MIRIGLVGEDPNDTTAISNLLGKKYKVGVQFIPLVKRIRGFQLNNPKIARVLPIEFRDKKCSFVIYIKDLDGFKSEVHKVNYITKWFEQLDGLLNKKGILLNNIWELEALIFADIETFNSLYGVKCNFKGDPTKIKDPKEELKRITFKSKKQYQESHCPEIFDKLNINNLIGNCSYFSDFVLSLNKRLD